MVLYFMYLLMFSSFLMGFLAHMLYAKLAIGDVSKFKSMIESSPSQCACRKGGHRDYL